MLVSSQAQLPTHPSSSLGTSDNGTELLATRMWPPGNTDVSVSVNAPFGFGASAGGTASGWVVDVGAEYAFRNNWSAKIEYDHYDFGSDSSVFFAGSSVTFDAVKAGINYKFGGPGGPWPF